MKWLCTVKVLRMEQSAERNDASHRRGLMNEAVKIGSYEDDDYSCLQVLIETVSSAKHISSFVCKACLQRIVSAASYFTIFQSLWDSNYSSRRLPSSPPCFVAGSFPCSASLPIPLGFQLFQSRSA